jgi:hypothetical protein
VRPVFLLFVFRFSFAPRVSCASFFCFSAFAGSAALTGWPSAGILSPMVEICGF